MKYLAVLLSLSLSFVSLAQETPEIMHNALLQEGDLFSVGKVSVVFKEVISDSRCPKQVTCIWDGEAKVLLGIYENGKFLENRIVSSTAANSVQQFTAAGMIYNISGIQLLPYPEVHSKKIKPEYTLRLSLSEKS
ncbi:MAG: hypothetical protein ABJ092_07480 [Gillisia sp.]